MIFRAGKSALRILCTGAAMLTIGTTVLLCFLIGTETIWPWLPLLLVLPTAAVYLPRLVRSLYGEINDRQLYVRFGVLWRRETVVPFTALRTFETWAPPLHAAFGCRVVVLRFAGGCVWLPLLDKETARRLTARLEG